MIRLFCRAFIEDKQPLINGDGTTSRDFTFIENVLHANELALFTGDSDALNQVYNVACGDQVTLNDMVKMLQQITGKDIQPLYGPERPGDVKHSLADISKIQSKLGYRPQVLMQDGMKEVYEWNKMMYMARQLQEQQ